MSEQRTPETRPEAARSASGNRHHIEKGWTVYDAAERPIGNVTEVDTARDVLGVDGRPQGFDTFEVSLGYVDRAGGNDVFLTRVVDTDPNATGGIPRFVEAPATSTAGRGRAGARAESATTGRTEPSATVRSEPKVNVSTPPTTASSRPRPVSTPPTPYTEDTMREFTPAYATAQARTTDASWPDENQNGWSASTLAKAGLALGGLAASAYFLRRRMRRKTAFERFMDMASDYSGAATDFAKQRHPAWWASLAAAALPLAYYAWPSSKPTYTDQARTTADDFTSYLTGLAGMLPGMSDSRTMPAWQNPMPALQRAFGSRDETSWWSQPNVAGTIGALGAGAATVYAIRRMTAKSRTHTRIADVMTRQPRVIQPDATVADAAAMMRRLNVGALPVCDGTRLIGMLTDRDITTRSTADGRDPHLTVVRDVMSPGIAWATEDDLVEEAARIMREHRIRRLPIVDERHSLVGVVSLGDLAVDVRDDDMSGETLEQISEPGHPSREL
jgi:CBS domain-containing protein